MLVYIVPNVNSRSSLCEAASFTSPSSFRLRQRQRRRYRAISIIPSTSTALNGCPSNLLLKGIGNVRTTTALPQTTTTTTRTTNRLRMYNRKSSLLSSTASSVVVPVNTAAEVPVDLKYMEFPCDDHTESDVEQHVPVFLLHGLLGQKRNFATFGSALASQLDKRRRIFALDLRNHGDNGHDWRDEMSHSYMAQDVLALMDTLNISEAIVIGHSMGGKIAMNLALSHPHRIAGLVVLDTSPVAYDSSNNPAWKAVEHIVSVVREVKLEPGKTKRDIDVDLRQSLEDPALRAFVLTNLESVGGDSGTKGDRGGTLLRWKINIESIASELDQIADFVLSDDDDASWDETLGNDRGEPLRQKKYYEGDAFFINGGASNFVRAGHMPVIAEYFPNYMLTTIRGAGHWVHAEAPDDTLALLKRYLDR